jgi:hypothetical protein
MKAQLGAGDSFDWDVSVAGYPATDGWTLTYYLTAQSATGNNISFNAASGGSDGDAQKYRVQIGPGTSNTWTPGAYGWASKVEKTGASIPVDDGQTVVTANRATSPAGTDFRSQAQKAVDDLKAARAAYSVSQGGIKEYSIGSRRMVFKNDSDFVVAIQTALGDLALEQRATAMAKGLGDPFRIQIGLSRG